MLRTKGHTIELGQATSCHLFYTKEEERKAAQEKFQMSFDGSEGCRPRGCTQPRSLGKRGWRRSRAGLSGEEKLTVTQGGKKSILEKGRERWAQRETGWRAWSLLMATITRPC